jgi:hypothetical protein
MSGILSGTLALIQARLASATVWVDLCNEADVDPAGQVILGVGGFGADDAFLSAVGGSRPLSLPLAQVQAEADSREPAGNRRWQRTGSAFLDVVTPTGFGMTPDGYLQALQLAEDLELHFENATGEAEVFMPSSVGLVGPPTAFHHLPAWRGAWAFRLRLAWLKNPRT